MFARLAALVVVLSLVVSLVLTGVRLVHQVVPRSLRAMGEDIRARWQPNDVVVTTPAHQVGVLVELGDLDPLQPKRLVWDDIAHHSRVHLVILDALGVDGALEREIARHADLVFEREWPGVKVQTFSVRREHHRPIIFDAWTQFAQLDVRATYPDGERARCDHFAGDRWLCPRDPHWSYVGPRILAIDDEPRRCLWMHPLAAGGSLEVFLPGTSWAGSEIALGTGFARSGVAAARAPVQVTLTLDAQPLVAIEQPVSSTWRRAAVPIGRDGLLGVTVRTADNAAAHVCVSLTVRRSS